MKKLVIVLVGGLMMMSCGEKEMTPQEKQLLELNDRIENYEARRDSALQQADIISDSIVNFWLERGIDSYDAHTWASMDLEIKNLEAEYHIYDNAAKEAKEKQMRLATVIAALKK